MSLFRYFFGENELADALLASLGLTRNDFGRYRDCILDETGIVIYTRNGGRNFERYTDVFQNLSKHPCYRSHGHDSYDPTYVLVDFCLPKEFAEDLKALAAQDENFIPSEKLQVLLKTCKKWQKKYRTSG